MTYPKDSDEDSTESDVNPPNQMMAVGSIGIKLSVDGLDTHDGISRNEKVSASAAIQALLHTLVYINVHQYEFLHLDYYRENIHHLLYSILSPA